MIQNLQLSDHAVLAHKAFTIATSRRSGWSAFYHFTTIAWYGRVGASVGRPLDRIKDESCNARISI